LEVANDDLYEGGAKFESKEIESNKELVALREDFDFIIVANGSWIGKFHELTGVGVRTTRQNWYQVVGSVDSEFPYLKDMRNSHRIVPDGNGLRLFNGAVGEEFEPTGVYKEDKQEVLSLQSYLETWFPGSKSQLVGNSCQYACSPDYLPVLTQAEGITFLCPPAGGGVKTGPRLAAACVRMALDEISEFPQFDVSRFESTAK